MVLALSLFLLLVGAFLACSSQCWPAVSIRAEQTAGFLFLFGMALLGSQVPLAG